MKKLLLLLLLCCGWMTQRAAPADSLIRISTDETDLVLKISPAGRLYQVYLGEKLRHFEDARRLNWQVPNRF